MKKEANPTRLLFIFIAAIFILGVLSLSYKLFIQIRESTFQYKTFNILAVDRDAYLFHIDKEENKLVIIKYPESRYNFINQAKLMSAIETGVPLDAMIFANNQTEFKNGVIEFGSVVNSIFSEKSYRLTDINNYDLVKIYLAISSIPEKNRTSIEANDKGKVEIEDYVIFRDREIFNEKISIQVINSTGINGLGGRVGQMLTNVGYNVVSTETAEHGESVIKIEDMDMQNNKTTLRLSRIFETNREIATSGGLISDILIILGKDLKSDFEEE